MALIFAILFFVFILYPVGKALWRGYQLQQSWKRATQGFRDAYRHAASGADGSRHAAPKRKKKKIDPNVGEYVAFEEVTVSASETTETQTGQKSTYTNTYTESQIEDAVWEEIRE